MKYLTTSKEKWKHLKPYAKVNRHNMTLAEKIVWAFLKKGNLGVKFRKQQAIADYIVDFVCLELKLVIEIDGDSHLEKVEYDIERTKVLNGMEFEVIRFTNDEVFGNGNLVEQRIRDVINNLGGNSLRTPPQPSPKGAGEINIVNGI